MEASIIVCTYNRADSLLKTLHALRDQQMPSARGWEVIVVDNNSRDHTRRVVEEMQIEWPLLRYEFEQQQGLSHARNHGIAAAKGDILLFTDDDVLPEPDWMERTLSGLQRYDADACGGYIAPIWEQPPPPWLSEKLYGFLALKIENGGPRQLMSPADMPYGANMAFRKDVFERIGVFDTNRGRKGKVLASGEEGDLFERLLNAGGRIYYFPDARVHHYIEVFRTKKSYFRRWRYQGSKNIAETRMISGERKILGVPAYLFMQMVRALFRVVRAKVVFPPDEAFLKEMVVCHFLGLIAGLYRKRSAKG